MQIAGTGSIGKRCILLRLEETAKDNALILQLKEARTVSSRTLRRKERAYQPGSAHSDRTKTDAGASDIFLAGIEDSSTGIQYYCRQFKDMKGSLT